MVTSALGGAQVDFGLKGGLGGRGCWSSELKKCRILRDLVSLETLNSVSGSWYRLMA